MMVANNNYIEDFIHNIAYRDCNMYGSLKSGSKAHGLENAAKGVGYLGSFEIDYQSDFFRANGMVGPYFGALKKYAAQGVKLSSTDAFIHPEDLEMMKQYRRMPGGKTGQRMTECRVVDVFGRVNWVQIFTHVITDRYGNPLRSHGIIIDITSLREEPAHQMRFALPGSDAQGLMDNLVEAIDGARRLRLHAIENDIRNMSANLIKTLIQDLSKKERLQ